jgi:hypothetical protein
MNHLAGQLCNKLIACKFILDGKLKSDFIALYLYTDSDHCYMIFLDDEDYTFKVNPSAKRPKDSDIEGDEEFKYIHEDIAEKYNLKGKRILSFKESDKGTFAEGILSFSDNSNLTLTYDYESEKEYLLFENNIKK